MASSAAPHPLQALEDITRACLAAGGAAGADTAEPWVADCTEMLLDAWSSLLSPQCGYAMAAVGLPRGAAECAARTFGGLVEAALADAAAGAHEVGSAPGGRVTGVFACVHAHAYVRARLLLQACIRRVKMLWVE